MNDVGRNIDEDDELDEIDTSAEDDDVELCEIFVVSISQLDEHIDEIDESE
jgi:hypothetical protein